jgi:hypothetical protein
VTVGLRDHKVRIRTVKQAEWVQAYGSKRDAATVWFWSAKLFGYWDGEPLVRI